MASCDSFQEIFNKPVPENATHIDSLSKWNHNKPKQSSEISSFTELFGELHFKESLKSSSLPFLSNENRKKTNPQPPLSFLDSRKKQERRRSKEKEIFSSMNLESLHTCTEGLGFESFDDADEDVSGNEEGDKWKNKNEKLEIPKHYSSCGNLYGRSRKFRSFPPPIPSIGRNGKPWVIYKPFRSDGRLVLKEVQNPTQGHELMHACREDGRLTLHLVHRDEDKVKNEGELEEAGDDAEEIEYGKGKTGKHEVRVAVDNRDNRTQC